MSARGRSESHDLPERLLKPMEVAEILQVSRSEVYALIASGRLPSIRVSARVVRVHPSDLMAFIEAHRRGRFRDERSGHDLRP